MATKYGEAIAVLNTEMKQVTKDIKDLKKGQEEGFAAIVEKFENLDKKYASKGYEKVLWVIGTAVILYFVNGLLGLFPAPQIVAPSTTTNTTTTNTPTGSTSTSNTQDSEDKPTEGVLDILPKGL